MGSLAIKRSPNTRAWHHLTKAVVYDCWQGGVYFLAGENPDLPSDGWLGRCAKNQAVCAPGLWNVSYADHTYVPHF